MAAKKKSAKKSKNATVCEVVTRREEITTNPNSPQITQGMPRTVNANLSVKLNTNKFESMSIGAMLTVDLKADADIDKAVDEIYTFLNSQLKPRIAAVRKRYGDAEARD